MVHRLLPMLRTLCALIACLGAPTAFGAVPLPDASGYSATPAGPSRGSQKPLGLMFAGGAGAAVVSVPVALYLGSLMGTWSNQLLAAALPSLLLVVLLPPVTVTLTEWWVVKAVTGRAPSLRPAFWWALGAQVLALVGGVALGVNTGNPTSVALFTAAEAVVLPGVVTWSLSSGMSPSLPGPALGSPSTQAWVMPLFSVNF